MLDVGVTLPTLATDSGPPAPLIPLSAITYCEPFANQVMVCDVVVPLLHGRWVYPDTLAVQFFAAFDTDGLRSKCSPLKRLTSGGR